MHDQEEKGRAGVAHANAEATNLGLTLKPAALMVSCFSVLHFTWAKEDAARRATRGRTPASSPSEISIPTAEVDTRDETQLNR
jgi:hypothetical protein